MQRNNKTVKPLRAGNLAIFVRNPTSVKSMKEEVKSTASRFGIIAAVISIAYTLIAYLFDLSLMVNPWMGIALWVIGLVIYIVAVSQTRNKLGGFISFRDAFSSFILAYIISSLLATAFNILLFTAIDPGAAEELQDMSIEATVEMLENFGAPTSQIEDTIDQMEGTNQFSVLQLVKGFFWGIVVYAIIGLIVAAIMKRNPPVITDNGDSPEE